MLNGQEKVWKEPAVARDVINVPIYKAFTTIYLEKNGSYKIKWSCEARKELMGQDEQLIEGCRKGNLYKKYMAECFTLDEAKMLKEYLWRTYRWGMSYSRYTKPTLKRVLRMDGQGEITTVNALDELRLVELCSLEDYVLPFDVKGYGYEI